MEYVNALSQEDADLATEVQNVRNTLAARKDEQQQLQERAARALQKVQAAEAALKAKLAEQQDALDELNAKMARAEELVKKLEKQYQQELAALTGLDFHAGAILKVCPVGQPHAVYDGFGAPRFGGRLPPARRQRHHRPAGDADLRDLRRVRAGRLQRPGRQLGRRVRRPRLHVQRPPRGTRVSPGTSPPAT